MFCSDQSQKQFKQQPDKKVKTTPCGRGGASLSGRIHRLINRLLLRGTAGRPALVTKTQIADGLLEGLRVVQRRNQVATFRIGNVMLRRRLMPCKYFLF